jgi:hypothetical protein
VVVGSMPTGPTNMNVNAKRLAQVASQVTPRGFKSLHVRQKTGMQRAEHTAFQAVPSGFKSRPVYPDQMTRMHMV